MSTVSSVVSGSSAGYAIRRYSYSHYAEQQNEPLGGYTKKARPYRAKFTSDKGKNDGPRHAKNCPDSLTHPDDVISQSLREEVGGGDPAEAQHGEIEASHRKTNQCDLLSYVDLPTVDYGCEGGKEV